MQYSTHLFRHLRLTIGSNIHNHRVRQKMPLQKLSKLSSIPENLIDLYELGKYEIRLEQLFRISCALKVDLTRLVE